MEYKLTFKKYTEALRQGKLLGLKCNNCGTFITPPKNVCLKCNSTDLEVVQLQRRGEIDTFTVIRVPPEGFEDKASCIVARVKLAEGPIIMGVLLDVDPNNASLELIGKKVRIGHMEVKGDKFSGTDGVIPTFSIEH
jgi:hypothetical protein